MNQTDYLIQFERYLRVGGPKRKEILVELKTHIDELHESVDITVELGEPKQLADKYNRTHIGLLGSPVLFYVVPIVYSVLVISAIYFFGALDMRFDELHPDRQWGMFYPPELSWMFGTMMTAWLLFGFVKLGRAIGGMYQRWVSLAMLTMILFSLAMVVNALSSSPTAAVLPSTLVALAAVIPLIFVMMLYEPWENQSSRASRVRIILNWFVGLLAIIGVFFFVALLVRSFGHDSIFYRELNLQRLLIGPYRRVAEFLQTAYGSYTIAAMLELPFIVFVVRRMRFVPQPKMDFQRRG